WNRGEDPIAAFAAHFRTAASRTKKAVSNLPLDERLANYIVEGTKDGLIPDLALKLKEAAPLDIINGPLMAGMGEVGRLFNNNELIVAEVLQSAEAMKAAVSHLEQFMEKAESSTRGSVILATVKGDVHDIGKNLVDIILSNNGYRVINLGIKVPPEVLIHAAREHQPDAIGLSGLLVKSAQQMVVTAADLKDAGIGLPLLVGGAALSDKFTRGKIAPAYGGLVAYARDAMSGLALMNKVMNADARAQLQNELSGSSGAAIATATALTASQAGTQHRSSRISLDVPIPPIEDLSRHVIEVTDLDEVWSYINPQMLYGRHLGFKGRFDQLLHAGDRKAAELEERVERIKEECRRGAMHARAVWQFFEVESEGNRIHFFAGRSSQEPIETFEFPRQAKSDGIALSDLVLPPVRDERGQIIMRDHVAVFVTTAGEGIAERAEQAKANGEYLRSYGLQVLALETAEATAEWAHSQLRSLWAFPDPDSLSRQALFQARYRGKRYSFGYAACPDLESQAGLFRLIHPEAIGVHLTEGFMMDPDASVSALVFHHPDATYFSVGAPEMVEATAD
ncbi:MAG TPA: vitamin B12 dependent-methionine synthase activation domain-containing protein, partial [Blastocatellia bacterium]